MWPNPQKTADWVTCTEEILHGKLYILCSVIITPNYFHLTFVKNFFCIQINFEMVETVCHNSVLAFSKRVYLSMKIKGPKTVYKYNRLLTLFGFAEFTCKGNKKQWIILNFNIKFTINLRISLLLLKIKP